MTSPSSEITVDQIPLSNFQPRMLLGIDPAVSPEEWEWRPEPIWVVPDPALQWGYDNQHHVHAGHTMILPAEEREWRDNQHYRAYVRPSKEEA